MFCLYLFTRYQYVGFNFYEETTLKTSSNHLRKRTKSDLVHDKTLTPTKNSKKQSYNIKMRPTTSITQRLLTDLGRSVGVTTQM